ncbi:hypothetical protein HCH15_03050 [Corynebacterium testudinoris]|uniref:hypothetical protein n=1 Tax=Corynebacterium testudinoris TaxID=136857 RepID=UPI001C8BE87C|nr:hypothetical protein [Corynebacterium testudinoris]MBX8995163.1 hypothetical protein [Corynebacterium testudinoris]
MTEERPGDYDPDSNRRWGWRGFLEHPENDLTADADFANLRPPDPQSPEELASWLDPVVQAERNRQSSRQALQFLAAIPAITFVLGLGLLVVFRLIGGPECVAGEAVWLCTRTSQIVWPLVTSIVPIIGVLGCAIIMTRKLNSYTRWRPWMGVFWVMVPFCMVWLITAGQILIPALEN